MGFLSDCVTKLFGIGKTTDDAKIGWSRTAIPGDCYKDNPEITVWTDKQGQKREKAQYQCLDGTYTIETANGEIKKQGYDNNNT